jgi:hypothetical protein
MAKVADLYGGGIAGKLMRAEYRDDRGNPKPKVEQFIQKRHIVARDLVGADGVYRYGEHEWKVPLGLLYYWHRPLRRHQMVVFHPWWATWISPKTSRRLRKEFTSLPHAIHFVATKAQYVDPRAAVTAKQPYDVIPALRGKLPKLHNGRRFYWCPCCVTARPFFAIIPERKFSVLKKVWSDEKGRYIWVQRDVRVLACQTCGITNRDGAFRRSNQPWEKRRFSQGVRRARRRK